MLKAPRILYFIGSAMPTKDEMQDAKRYGTNVAFRNASLIDDRDSGIEKCDGVAGRVPAPYAKQVPAAAKVMAEFNKSAEAPVGVEAPPAPVIPAAPVAPAVPNNDGWGQLPAEVPAAPPPPPPAPNA